MGPPSLDEKSIFSFWEPVFILFMAAAKPLAAPRPPLLRPSLDLLRKQYVGYDDKFEQGR
jgi:hypothetical protein